jgi:hypothetical protein
MITYKNHPDKVIPSYLAFMAMSAADDAADRSKNLDMIGNDSNH